MLKATDIYVLLGLLGLPADRGWTRAGFEEGAVRLASGQPPAEVVAWTQARFAEALGLSQAGISRSLARLAELGLIDRHERRVKRSAVEGLLVHGVPYLCLAGRLR